jgi:hypothetical protein
MEDAVSVAREAQAARLSKLAPPPPVVMLHSEPEPEPEPQPAHTGRLGWEDDGTPPPVRNMVAEIIDAVIDESSGGMDRPVAQLALPPAVEPSIEETVADAAARVAADLVMQASRAAASRRGQEGAEWHPQIEAFWVDGSIQRSSGESETGERDGPIRVEALADTPGSRVWHASPHLRALGDA